MNLRLPKTTNRRDRQGVMLVECLVYMAVLVLVLGVGFAAFYKCWDCSLGLRRTADDITGALHAGERWRADVRTTTAPARIEEGADEQILHLPHGTSEVAYRFAEGGVWRRSNPGEPWTQILTGVKSSRMLPDNRHRVTALRWELELNPRRKSVRLKPLFTFESMPQTTRPS